MPKGTTVSNRMLRNLSSKLYHSDKRRNITAIVAIALSAMLIITVLSTILSVTSLARHHFQMMFGTQAEGVYMNTSLEWFEELRDSGHFDEVAMVARMGYYETETSAGDDNVILYAEEKTAGWNFNEMLEGRWPKKDGEIVVDEHFVQNHGGNLHVGDTVQIKLKTTFYETDGEAFICGICTANDAMKEARVYVSEEFFGKDESGYGLQTYCRFEGGKYTDEDLINFLRESEPEAKVTAAVNPTAVDKPGVGAMALLGGLIVVTVICAGLMIYTIYYISAVKNVVQYGQLKLIGITEKQIKSIVKLHALRQYATGFPIGCLAGVLFGHMLMPRLASYMGLRGSSTLIVRPEYFICAALLSLIVVYFGIRKPMSILSQVPPIHTVGFTGSTGEKAGKVRSVRFTPGRFARRNMRKRRKRTGLVVTSMSIVVLLFVITTNIIHSLSLDATLSMFNFFADIEIASYDALYLVEVGAAANVQKIPNELRNELEKISQGMDTVYHYNLYMPMLLYEQDADKFCEVVLDNDSYVINPDDEVYDVMVKRAQSYRDKGTPIIMQQSYRFYDYDNIDDFEVFEGKLDRDKFESGDYILAVALDGEGNSYYHAGDVVNLYDEFPDEFSYERDENGHYPFFDNLRTKEYTVMAVVSDEYRNQMAWGDTHTFEFEYILPTNLMETFPKTPELFMVTMNAPDADTLNAVEPLVKDCLAGMGGEDVVSYRSVGTYKESLEELSMLVALIGNGMALLVGVMALVNFLNSTVSGIAERKEEFSTLQAIGMMKRLLLKVLRLENLYTVLWAVIPGYLLGHLISVAALRKASEVLPYIRPDTALLPGIVLAVTIAGLSMIYPNRRTDVGDRKA